MSNKQLRNVIRAVHLIAGLLILAFVYSEAARASVAFTGLLQVVILPVVTLSGIAMWQQSAISRLRRRLA